MAVSGPDVAAAHWAQTINGGGERVGWELARAFDTPLYVGLNTEDCQPDDVEVRELFDGTARKLLARGGLGQMAVNQYAWELADPLRDGDVLVSSGNEALAYVPPEDQTWVHYVHHTSRWSTDLLPKIRQKDYGRLSGPKRVVERLVRKAERQLYSRYASKPDLLVANSEVVARRVRRYWGVPRERVRVVYPPVPVDEYDPNREETGDYYLALQRLDWHKCVPEIVEAFGELDVPLLVAGDGSERDDVERAAEPHDNVCVLGYVDEQRKRDLLAGARATVVNAYAEDFGLTTAESLASGTPVVGVAEGMTQHLILDERTGVKFARGVNHLRAAVRQIDSRGVEWSEAKIAEWANQFGVKRFRDEMAAVVAEAREHHAIKPELATPDRDRVVADGGGNAPE